VEPEKRRKLAPFNMKNKLFSNMQKHLTQAKTTLDKNKDAIEK